MGGQLNASVQAVVQFLSVAVVGVVLSKTKALDRHTINKSGKVNFQALTPALLFSSVVGSMTFNDLSRLWPIAVFAVLTTAIGLALGYAFCRLFRIEAKLAYCVVNCSGFMNCGYLAWLVIPAIITASPNFQDTETAVAKSITYISLYTCTVMVLILTIPLAYVPGGPQEGDGPADRLASEGQERLDSALSGSRGSSLCHAVVVQQGLNTDPCCVDKSQSLGQEGYPGDPSGGLNVSSPGGGPDDGEAIQHATLDVEGLQPIVGASGGVKKTLYGIWLKVFHHPICNLSLLSCLVGLIVLCIRPLHDAFILVGKPLNWVYRAAKYLGGASSPMAMLVLGAELVQVESTAASSQSAGGLRPSRNQWLRALLVAVVVKLILVPLCVVLLTKETLLGRLIPDEDPVYKLVILMESAVPGATSLVVICASALPDMGPMSRMIFWQHVLALVSLTAASVWFLMVVS